ncbi:hypothetical protein GCM10027040_26400 [Halomonas shantousis]
MTIAHSPETRPDEPTVLSRLTDLVRRNPDIDVLWLYGSRAKGMASEDSDYDLAVAFRFPERDPLQKRLRPELLAQQWQDELALAEGMLSVVDINLAPVPLAMAIVRTGRTLCVNSALRLAREENRITSMWELDYQYHRQHFA